MSDSASSCALPAPCCPDVTFHFVGRTTVHGADAVTAGTKETLHGLKEGSEVIDDVGKTGLKSAEGTVKSIDRGTKTLILKTADGAEVVG